jgi:hypothetical protein
MPTLTLRDGASLTWDETVAGDLPDTSNTIYSESSANVLSTGTSPPDDPTEPAASTPSVTAEDVSAALAKVPPKWSATAMRFLKTLAAALVAAFVATGGTVEGIIHDPTAFLAAIGTAVVMAVQKFLSWKE